MMKSIKEVLQEKDLSNAKHYRYEFQVYGDRLAHELNDPRHLSLYIKLAKTMNRKLLESASACVKDAGYLKGANSKAKLFMWKLTQLKQKTS